MNYEFLSTETVSNKRFNCTDVENFVLVCIFFHCKMYILLRVIHICIYQNPEIGSG